MEKIELVQSTAQSLRHDAQPMVDQRMSDVDSSDFEGDLRASFQSVTCGALLLGMELARAKNETERTRIIGQIADVIPGFDRKMREIEEENPGSKQVLHENGIVGIRMGGGFK